MRARVLVVAAVLAGFSGSSIAGTHTLILALDGVGYDHMVEARGRGAFAGWGEPRPLVSTFPSMTNVGFVAILSPLGSESMPGYELRHFDYEQNEIVSPSLVGHKKHEGSWRSLFHAGTTSLWGKASGFLWPRRQARHELGRIEKLVLEEPAELMLGLVSATDGLAHLDGEEATVRLLLEFSERIERLRQDHAVRHGKPLRVVVLSDHGNGGGKIRAAGGVGRALKAAGLRPTKHLKRPEDVVLVTYGVCGYGAMFLAPDRAEVAARAVLGLPGVELAAWIERDGELRVLGPEAAALVRWRGRAPARRLAYEPTRGDPLRLAGARANLASAGRLDGLGFAAEDDWFEATAAGDYPDALARLVDALGGRFVHNAATVLFSYAPGYALGLSSARKGAWLLGGRPEATHGALDRASTWGVFLTSDAGEGPAAPLRAEQALAEWIDAPELRAALADWRHGSGLHRPRILH